MAADLSQPIAKPRDTVATPTGRVGVVTAVAPEGRREVQYIDEQGGEVIVKASLLRVLVCARPKPWVRRIL